MGGSKNGVHPRFFEHVQRADRADTETTDFTATVIVEIAHLRFIVRGTTQHDFRAVTHQHDADRIALIGGAQDLARAVDRPNVLWITSEDNGPHLGCYGDDYAVETPLEGA